MTAVELPHQPSGVPGGTAGQLPLLQQDNIAPTQLAEVIRNGTTQDAAADDHDPRMLGQYFSRRSARWRLRHHTLTGNSGGARRDNSSGPS